MEEMKTSSSALRCSLKSCTSTTKICSARPVTCDELDVQLLSSELHRKVFTALTNFGDVLNSGPLLRSSTRISSSDSTLRHRHTDTHRNTQTREGRADGRAARARATHLFWWMTASVLLVDSSWKPFVDSLHSARNSR